MKNRNLIKESQGIVDKDGIQWFDLSDLITDYVYDLQNGLNADPFYDADNESITKGNIESYYQYKHAKKIPSYIIPDWIGSFTINIIKDKDSNGTFLKKTSKLNDSKKLVFTIEIGQAIESPDLFCNTLVHEFQHAYTWWLALTKHIMLHNNRRGNLYMHASKGFDNTYYSDNFVPLAMQKFPDLIEINDDIFNNAEGLERIILTGFYHSDVDEIRSFIQEFAKDMMRIIKNNYELISAQIKRSLEFKGDFNHINKDEQYRSNILNNIYTDYNFSKYYKIYKAYYEFYKKLEKMEIDDNIATQVVKKCVHAIRMALYIPANKSLTKFEGDANNILKRVAKRQIPIYENVLKKMQKIFVKLIMEIPV